MRFRERVAAAVKSPRLRKQAKEIIGADIHGWKRKPHKAKGVAADNAPIALVRLSIGFQGAEEIKWNDAAVLPLSKAAVLRTAFAEAPEEADVDCVRDAIAPSIAAGMTLARMIPESFWIEAGWVMGMTFATEQE